MQMFLFTYLYSITLAIVLKIAQPHAHCPPVLHHNEIQWK